MKKLIKKSWFTGAISLLLLVLVFFLDLAILFQKTSVSGVENVWTLTSNKLVSDEFAIWGYMLKILFFVNLLPLFLSGYSLIRKKSFGFFTAIAYSFVYQVLIIVFKVIYSCLKTGSMVLAVINLLLLFVALAAVVFRKLALKHEKSLFKPKEGEEKAEKEIPADSKPFLLGMLVVLVLQIFALGIIFFVPFYKLSADSSSLTQASSVYLFKVMFSSSLSLIDASFYIVCLFLFFVSLFLFALDLPYFFSDKKAFSAKSYSLSYINIVFSAVFFLMGFFVCFYYGAKGTEARTYAFIPLIIVGLLELAFAFFKGRFDAANNIKEDKGKRKFSKGEPLIYLTLLTAITFLSMFLNIIRGEFEAGTLTSSVTLTGIKLLTDYASIGGGYQIVAFYLIVMLLASGIAFVLSWASFLSKYRYASRVCRISCYVNVLMVFMLGISGLYFTIAQSVNADNIKLLMDYYGLSYSGSYTYTLKTDAVYALIVEVIILVIMFARRAMDQNEASQEITVNGTIDNKNDTSGLAAGAKPEAKPLEPGKEEEKALTFDPCPAFSQLDSKEQAFKDDLANRKKDQASSPSLSGLVSFVVDYAKNSRLHLSYTPDDIACFLAGLGACRLSILQGMSGTGKTSLPKIFMEAIEGNCEIVEVESSWKDKNELLGYYNEFSSMYTPKKFTQALYKAALNKEIPTFIVLDEMNLSRIEYYFSDFLSLMENEEGKREIKLLNVGLYKEDKGVKSPYLALDEGTTLKVPSNVWFIGTANRDESTFVISDKVYDRAHTINFNKRAKKVRDFSAPIPKEFYTYDMIASLLSKALSGGSFDAESNSLIQGTEILLEPYNISFGNRILNQMEEFVDIYQACFPYDNVLNEAVESILLSKVVSKLEVKTIENKDELIRGFKALKLEQCAAFVSRLNED